MPTLQKLISRFAILAVFAGIAGAQTNPSFLCYVSATAVPAMRAESSAELTGDIVISCTGGSAPTAGSTLPKINLTVFYNTNVTSRILADSVTTNALNPNEALLLIDEPGSGLAGYGAALPQSLCTSPLTGCVAAADTNGKAVVPGTSTPAPNVYQGVTSCTSASSCVSNAVTFFGIPVLLPGPGAWRVFRVTNVRLNALALAGSSPAGATAVRAALSISGNLSMLLSESQPTVGYVMNGLIASAGNTASFSKYLGQTKATAATLTYTEGFGAAFKTRVSAQGNTLYAGQIKSPLQNVPGAGYNSESGFVFPVSGAKVAGLADFGTRLKATFYNIGAGAHIYVSTANVNSASSPVTAPSPVGGSQANTAPSAYAVLVNGENAADGDAAGGAFPAVTASGSAPGNSGAVPIAEVSVSNGTGIATWEVVNTNPSAVESLKFGVYVTYAADSALNTLPEPTVFLGFAPSTFANVPDFAGPVPRFDSASSAAGPAYKLCTASSCLGVTSTHTGSFTQGQTGATYTLAVSNLAGANPTSGTVTVTETVPTGLTAMGMSGTGWSCNTTACTRNDALPAGASYPDITFTVNVASDAPSQLTNQASVSGGGSADAAASDPTAVAGMGTPVLVISAVHRNYPLSQGETGATYTVTVSNQTGAGSTSGTVTVTDTPPSGLTVTQMFGPGWACGGTTCTRSDALAGGANYPAITMAVNVAANALSPQVNVFKVSGGGASDAIATDSTAIVGGNLLSCSTNVTVTPALRGEGASELTGDIALICSGGTATAPGNLIPSTDITVTYNTALTSRLLPTTSPEAASNASEVLLLIDEPGALGLSGYGPTLPQMLCPTPLTGCAAYAGTVAGVTYGTAVSSGSTPAPNVYRGIVHGTSVTFYGVPVNPPAASGSRVFRIANVRVNAQPLADAGVYGTPVTSSIVARDEYLLPLSTPNPTVGYVSGSLNAFATNAANLSQCSSQTKAFASNLSFTELFGTAFKTRVNPAANTAYAGQVPNPVQNVPGMIYNSESGFVFPIAGANPAQSAGLTDFGTRLKATFHGIPAGAHLFVSTTNVNNSSLPVTVPNPIGGSEANRSANYAGFAQLVSVFNTEAASDGDAGGSLLFPAIAATDYGPANGSVPIAEVNLSNGVGSAVWEVVNTNPNINETFRFAVYVSYTGNPAQNSPLPGISTVELSYGPTSTNIAAADAGTPLPRFSGAAPGSPLFTIHACDGAASLHVAMAHIGNFVNGQYGATYTVTVSNAADAGPTSGTVRVTETLPAGLALVSMAGTGWSCPNGVSVCTRNDVLAIGASYPPIVVTVNVVPNVPSPQMNSVSVSGGGSATATVSDSTTIVAQTFGNMSMSPSGGTSATQTFSFVFSDSAGYRDLSWQQVVFSTYGDCSVEYTQSTNLIYLADDGGSLNIGPLALGSAGTLQNSHCTLNVGASSASGSGNTLTLNLALTFRRAFSGTNNVWARTASLTVSVTDLQLVGTWSPGNPAPSTVSVTPWSGSGSSQTFSFAFSDPAGVQDLAWQQVIVGSNVGGCYLYYLRSSNQIYFGNDAGTLTFGPQTLGTAGILQNSHCALDVGASSASSAGNTLTLKLALAFQGGFAGTKSVVARYATASGTLSDWQTVGTWTPVNPIPSVVSLTPSSGSGSSQTFTFVFSDPSGYKNLAWQQVIVGSNVGGCYVFYVPSTNLVYFGDDAGALTLGPKALGTGATLQNSHCALNVGASSASGAGTALTLRLAFTFQGGFAGTKSVIAGTASASETTSDWQTMGTWIP